MMELWFDSCHGQENFLFSKSSRPALGLTESLFSGQCEFFSQERVVGT